MRWCVIKFENPNGRYYYIFVQRDMLSDEVLTVVRGGRGCCVVRNVVTDDATAIRKEINRLIKKRLSRGYVLTQS